MAGCGSSSGTDRPAGTRASRSTVPATTTAPAATTPTTPTSASPPTTPVGYPSARDAATHLLDAWRAGDRVAAARGADPVAVAMLFAVPVGQVVDRGCDTGEFDTSSCQYKVGGGGLQLDMERRPAGWAVSGARFSPT